MSLLIGTAVGLLGHLADRRIRLEHEWNQKCCSAEANARIDREVTKWNRRALQVTINNGNITPAEAERIERVLVHELKGRSLR